MKRPLAEQFVSKNIYKACAPPLEMPTTLRQNTDGVESTLKIPQRVTNRMAEDLIPHKPVQRSDSRIHVLGAGSVGRFVAHSLASCGDAPPITLLSHRSDITQQWNDEGRKLEVISGNISRTVSKIDVRHVSMLSPRAGEGQEMIDKLIVTMQANATVPALLEIKDRLLPSSTICFLQSGMGVIDDVNAKIFANPATRPRYIVGLTSCGVHTQRGRTFTTMYTRRGNTYLSIVPKGMDSRRLRVDDEECLIQRMYYGWTSSSRILMRSLVRCPNLNAKGYQYRDVLQLQLEKLAVDAVLEPLSVVFDCTYGKLLEIAAARKLMRGLLKEIITAVHSFPELQRLEHFRSRFTLKALKTLIFRNASRNNHAIGTMLNDVRNGRRTDINFLNGYIVERGRELGMHCPLNSTVIEVVNVKQNMTRNERSSFIPMRMR